MKSSQALVSEHAIATRDLCSRSMSLIPRKPIFEVTVVSVYELSADYIKEGILRRNKLLLEHIMHERL